MKGETYTAGVLLVVVFLGPFIAAAVCEWWQWLLVIAAFYVAVLVGYPVTAPVFPSAPAPSAVSASLCLFAYLDVIGLAWLSGRYPPWVWPWWSWFGVCRKLVSGVTGGE